MTSLATFAAGCFWHVQYIFNALPGVVSTRAGYTGGTLENPTYENVCRGNTGHAEAVEVVFDPEHISYSELVDAFWKLHDPTQVNRQGPDVGSQYRSVIFFHNEDQKQVAESSRHTLEHTHLFQNPIATEIVPAKTFYPAEEYHQNYVEKHGGIDICPAPRH
ncbi:MAG: peptide-methionine (S)-S-oxide reductase MsrA [Candidatus Uhrbacteria bacterium]|nr:peptide-methionine (S)-S-oxide reductase MsrA [Candidatus Uhrbacteria bacterium]